MSLPPGFLEELRERTSLAQVVGRKVTWDSRKSNQGKGDLWAPCPFHQEKTASFHVDDRKGYFYCFGCHEKGDAIGFVMKTENLGFMESIELLANEAGLKMPARDPLAQQKAEKRTTLIDVVAVAQKFFSMGLRTSAAADARAYLDKRGLDESTIERFGIGYAPDGWQNLWDHLIAKDISPDLILEAGLAKPSTRGGKPYDVFRNRIMFPISDPRGRIIAFGGRAMDPADGAKYLNSPETPLFDKSRTLYHHAPAREAVGKGAPLIVAEGYMDVIALAQAGFEGAVAPLGTAVTEHHLALLWRMGEEPVIALDGDRAGLRAAHRVIDLALPRMVAGKGLRFAILPDGQDPDDFLRSHGARAMEKLIEKAQPMVDLLWSRETAGKIFDSPERRAALDRNLQRLTGQIQDVVLRRNYEQSLRDLRFGLFRNKRKTYNKTSAVPSPETKASLLAKDGDVTIHLRVAVILAAILRTPDILPDFEMDLERLSCDDLEHEKLRDALLRAHADNSDDIAATVAAEIGEHALETLLSARHVAIVPCVRTPGQTELAKLTVTEELAKLEAAAGVRAEVAEAVEDLTADPDERLTWRLSQAAAARNRAERPSQDNAVEFELGPNGAHIDKEARQELDALMQSINFNKRR